MFRKRREVTKEEALYWVDETLAILEPQKRDRIRQQLLIRYNQVVHEKLVEAMDCSQMLSAWYPKLEPEERKKDNLGLLKNALVEMDIVAENLLPDWFVAATDYFPLELREHVRRNDALFEWIEFATKGLWIGAKRRVCQEIVSHYVDALQDKLACGSSIEDANSEALTSLGRPRVARKGFRKTYLTENDINALGPRKIPNTVVPLFFFIVNTWIIFLKTSNNFSALENLWNVLMCISMMIIAVNIHRKLVPFLRKSNRFLSDKIWDSIAISMPVLLWCVELIGRDYHESKTVLLIILCAFAPLFYLWIHYIIRISSKIKCNPLSANDINPV